MERSRLSHQEQIAAEAADWFVLLQESNDAGVREEFTQWLLRSPAHLREFLAVTRAWGQMSVVSADALPLDRLIEEARADVDEPNVVQLPKRASPLAEHELRIDRRKRRWSLRVAAAAAVAVLALGVSLAGHWWQQRQAIVTVVGEQRTLLLEDGSVVRLNTDSRIRVRFADKERRIELPQGEALFQVAKDAQRPFLVVTPQATVRAVGTEFNVRTLATGTAVAVLEGKVEVRGVVQPEVPQVKTQLAAGERATVEQGGQIQSGGGPSLEQVLAWADRKVVFRETTLTDVIDELNRYQTRPIRIADPQLATLRINGSFSVNDVESLLVYLERYHGLVRSRDADSGAVVLSKP